MSTINHLYKLSKIIIVSCCIKIIPQSLSAWTASLIFLRSSWHGVRSNKLVLVPLISLIMDKFNPPQEQYFSFEHWKLWKQLMLYITATEKTKKSDKLKSSILLACIGSRGKEVYNMFVFNDHSMKMDFNYILQVWWLLFLSEKCDFHSIQYFL